MKAALRFTARIVVTLAAIGFAAAGATLIVILGSYAESKEQGR